MHLVLHLFCLLPKWEKGGGGGGGGAIIRLHHVYISWRYIKWAPGGRVVGREVIVWVGARRRVFFSSSSSTFRFVRLLPPVIFFGRSKAHYRESQDLKLFIVTLANHVVPCRAFVTFVRHCEVWTNAKEVCGFPSSCSVLTTTPFNTRLINYIYSRPVVDSTLNFFFSHSHREKAEEDKGSCTVWFLLLLLLLRNWSKALSTKKENRGNKRERKKRAVEPSLVGLNEKIISGFYQDTLA